MPKFYQKSEAIYVVPISHNSDEKVIITHPDALISAPPSSSHPAAYQSHILYLHWFCPTPTNSRQTPVSATASQCDTFSDRLYLLKSVRCYAFFQKPPENFLIFKTMQIAIDSAPYTTTLSGGKGYFDRVRGKWLSFQWWCWIVWDIHRYFKASHSDITSVVLPLLRMSLIDDLYLVLNPLIVIHFISVFVWFSRKADVAQSSRSSNRTSDWVW